MTAENTKIIYITRDIERALGMWPNENYSIVSNKTPCAVKVLRELESGMNINDGKTNEHRAIQNILLIESLNILDTAELLENGKTIEFISRNNARNNSENISDRKVSIMVFKNTSRIEDICEQNGWNLLNPPSALSEKYENKITQVEWLGELTKYLPSYSIGTTKEIKWKKEPFVVQWAHGHTGDGTILINSPEELRTIQEKFPDRVARATVFVNGPSFTVNIVVAPNDILVGNISYQITGLPSFTDNLFSTVGNDWSLTHNLLSDSEIAHVENMAREIGGKMRADGWKGLFGIDVMRDDERNQIFLIEINARQPASTTFESELQKILRAPGNDGLTTFEAHILALHEREINRKLVHINDGAQIIKRLSKDDIEISSADLTSLESSEYNVIKYSNITINSDQIRIQSKKGIMEAHGKLNTRGKEILEIISRN